MLIARSYPNHKITTESKWRREQSNWDTVGNSEPIINWRSSINGYWGQDSIIDHSQSAAHLLHFGQRRHDHFPTERCQSEWDHWGLERLVDLTILRSITAPFGQAELQPSRVEPSLFGWHSPLQAFPNSVEQSQLGCVFASILSWACGLPSPVGLYAIKIISQSKD